MECGGGGAGGGRAAGGQAVGRHGTGAPDRPDRPTACATSRPSPLARWRTGHRRVRLRARRRDRAGLDDPHRRRAGHRQVHAAAPGRRSSGDRGPHGALRQRRGVARPDPAPGRPPHRRRRGGARARRDAARGHRRRRRRDLGRRRRHRLDPDRLYRHAGERARQRGAGAGVLRPAHALRQGERDGGDRGRPRHQGRRASPGPRPSSTSSIRCSTSRARSPSITACSAPRRIGSARWTSWASSR